jgi:hypothetical protein
MGQQLTNIPFNHSISFFALHKQLLSKTGIGFVAGICIYNVSNTISDYIALVGIVDSRCIISIVTNTIAIAVYPLIGIVGKKM